MEEQIIKLLICKFILKEHLQKEAEINWVTITKMLKS